MGSEDGRPTGWRADTNQPISAAGDGSAAGLSDGAAKNRRTNRQCQLRGTAHDQSRKLTQVEWHAVLKSGTESNSSYLVMHG
jgi:hypothetical protein